MKFADDILNDRSLPAWRDHLREQAESCPETWVDGALCSLASYSTDIQPFWEEVFKRGEQSGWGSFGTAVAGGGIAAEAIMEAISYGNWDLVGWILKIPVDHDLSHPDLDYLALLGITEGVWTHLDLMRPDILLKEGNIGKIGRDIFKHNENTYHNPLDENVIRQLVKLPKHANTAAILGRDFSYTQRTIDCETDIEIPGVLASLVLMVHSGWLDLNAARAILDPNEGKILATIARIEKAALEQVSAMPRSVNVARRI